MTDFQIRRYLQDVAAGIDRRCRDANTDIPTLIESARQAIELAQKELDRREGVMLVDGKLKIG